MNRHAPPPRPLLLLTAGAAFLLVLVLLPLALLQSSAPARELPAPPAARLAEGPLPPFDELLPADHVEPPIPPAQRSPSAAAHTPAPAYLDPVEPAQPGSATNGHATAQPPYAATLPTTQSASAPTSQSADERISVFVAPADLPLLPETQATAPPDRSAAARQQRLRQFGGTAQTENAVELGLRWLAEHQEPDGRWDRFAFHRMCPPQDRCAGMAVWREQLEMDPGITGLCLLAFLGAGYTDRDGPYQDTVARGMRWLLRMQQPDGGFSITDTLAGYNDSVAVLALAEFYELTGDPDVRPALEAAVQRLVRSQQPLGGWDYSRRGDTGRNDTSITGWAVQALQAARAGGVHVPSQTLCRAALHFVRLTEPDGRVRYADTGLGTVMGEDMKMTYRYGAAMTAVGMACGELLGMRPESGLMRRQRALLSAELPSLGLARGGDRFDLHSEYYWYYGTIAMFQTGGDSWDRWNGALRDVILPIQERPRTTTHRDHAHGSWPPFAQGWGRWGRMGGRVYVTAINVLTLEIYYRHTPAFLDRGHPPTAREWREFLAAADPRERRSAVEFLRNARLEIAEPALLPLLADAETAIALRAAAALSELESPMGLPALRAAFERLDSLERRSTALAIQSCEAILKRPPASGVVRFVDGPRRLATLDLDYAWAGMRLRVVRPTAGRRLLDLAASQPTIRLVVLSRFSDAPQVVALIEGDASDLPQPGDAVRQERRGE